MEFIKVVYGRSSWKPISLAIQLRTLCKWSHVGAIVGKDVIESVGNAGVVRTPIAEFLARYSEVEIKELPVVSQSQAEDFLVSRLGSKYDYRAVAGYLLSLGLNDLNSFHCAELIAESSGWMFGINSANITPKTLYNISRLVGVNKWQQFTILK